MSGATAAEEALKSGDPAAALALLQTEVRNRPADAGLRVFLVQLLCVLGQWERALNQLKVAADLDPSALPMAQMYGAAIRCEAIRTAVFEGTKSPMIFGEPDQWLALLIESLLVRGQGDAGRSEELRLRAFEDAPTSTGAIDGRPFAWIADADSRLGPVLEAMINGRYYWIPFARLTRVDIEAPEDLRDVVWMPAHLEFENGGETLALIPTRYPGSESSTDGSIALARKTIWDEAGPEAHHGLGQRLIGTDDDETPLMDIRQITIDAGVDAGAEHDG
jgi:type VI secretion system protein ImpE